MNRKRYKYIHRLVEKITTSPSNNMEFNCYGHLVHLESETDCYVSVAVYHTTDRYSGELADFSFDYWTHELYVEYAGRAPVWCHCPGVPGYLRRQRLQREQL